MNARRLGLRIQILLSLAIVLAVAFLPLFFAVSKMSRSTLNNLREKDARSLARAIAAHVGDHVERGGIASIDSVLHSHIGAGGALAIGVYDANGVFSLGRGEDSRIAQLRVRTIEARESVEASLDHVEVIIPKGAFVILVEVPTSDTTSLSIPLVRLFALYMGLFGFLLLVFLYIVLTRLIVRPIDRLEQITSRIALGSRSLDWNHPIRASGARELRQLATSIQRMTETLLAKEEAMQRKIDELSAAKGALSRTETQLAGSERLASVGRLAAGVAHEIGNPIAAILGMEELLLEGGLEPKEERDFLERMKKETERVHVVLKDLLDFARQGDTSRTEPAMANVQDIAEDVFALVRPQRDFKQFVLACEVPRDLHLAIPSSKLTQVFLNLVLNAGHAMIHAKVGTGVRIAARVSGSVATIYVEDDGPGIPSELGGDVFEPFFTTKDVGEGTGLGLSVCRGIVQTYGGTIRLENPGAKGCRFEITLPIA
ncbi:MAG: HAMP domain-containing histidine kinase [Polyangiaceae bacterium]|nr:HAMP domain-containing histidine kinase [Polyangiaceae bacterium]